MTPRWFGPDRDSAIIFCEYADEINREVGIDVYERKAALQANISVIQRLLRKFRRDKTFSDDSILDDVWQEYLQAQNILIKEEQFKKDEYLLAKARAAKHELRRAGLSDAARFGYCSKIRGCPNSKEVRLLVRGFCPDCRGVTVQQNATDDGSSISVTVDPTRINHKVLGLTTEERRTKVQAAKRSNPTASDRQIAKITNVPRSTVQDILRQGNREPDSVVLSAPQSLANSLLNTKD